jgi:hypothetical protein
MSVEHLIGLETAMAELGSLYTVARRFKTLHVAAETELLPRTRELAAELRSKVRHGSLIETAVEEAARYIAELRADWEQRLNTVRESEPYQRALSAWRGEASDQLTDLLCKVIAGLVPVSRPPTIFIGFSVTVHHKGSPSQHFQPVERCAARVASCAAEGIPAEPVGSSWWDEELTYLQAVDDPSVFETPVSLRIDPAQMSSPVLKHESEPGFRIYAYQRLRVPFSVVLQREATDEWWEATDQPYEEFRDALLHKLAEIRIAAEIG